MNGPNVTFSCRSPYHGPAPKTIDASHQRSVHRLVIRANIPGVLGALIEKIPNSKRYYLAILSNTFSNTRDARFEDPSLIC